MPQPAPEPEGRAANGPRAPEAAFDPRARALIRSFSEALKILNTSLSLESVLRDLARLGRSVLSARYGAVGVLGPEGDIARFVTSGLREDEIKAIGQAPQGHGLLGAVIADGRPLRSANIAGDSRAVGFPANHPPMTSFLGVPIRRGTRVLGNLYVTDKTTGDGFDAVDEWVATVLADHAALAIERATLSAARDAFLSVAAHELRSPVGALRLAIESASEQAAESDTPAAIRELLREVERGVDELSLEVDDLLDASRLDRGALRVQRSTVDLRQVCQAAVDRMRWALATDRVIAKLPSEPIWGRWDRRRLERAVANLLENALRYSPADTPVWIVARSTGARATIQVRDRGPGIDAADQDRIWQPFVRGSQSHGTQRGAGLGLYIVREIVSAHGGSITLDSQTTVGTTVSVTLPLRPSGAIDA